MFFNLIGLRSGVPVVLLARLRALLQQKRFLTKVTRFVYAEGKRHWRSTVVGGGCANPLLVGREGTPLGITMFGADKTLELIANIIARVVVILRVRRDTRLGSKEWVREHIDIGRNNVIG